MLEYAANGSVYWQVGQLREAFEAICARCGRNPEEELRRVLGEQADDLDGYWRSVEKNLKDGRVRLLFVTDEAPAELRRLVEFMNEKMQPDVEVLIIEVKQFIGEGHKALVPRLIGRVERAAAPSGPALVSRDQFLAGCPPYGKQLFERIFHDAAATGLVILFGTKGFSARLTVPGEASPVTFAYGFPPNCFQFYFDPRLPLTDQQATDLRQKLLAVGLFKESGRRTLTSEVDVATLPKALLAWKVMSEWAVGTSGAGAAG